VSPSPHDSSDFLTTKAEGKKQMEESNPRSFVRRNERKGFGWLRTNEKLMWSLVTRQGVGSALTVRSISVGTKLQCDQ
jgi:hypothetical protein